MKLSNIIFYDGNCGFCSFWVQFILKHDTKSKFRFAAQQGAFGRQYLTVRQTAIDRFDTIYVLNAQGKLLSRSSAVIYILSELGGVFVLFKLALLIPKFIRDGVYRFIAAHRSRIFRPYCVLPAPGQRERFIG